MGLCLIPSSLVLTKNEIGQRDTHRHDCLRACCGTAKKRSCKRKEPVCVLSSDTRTPQPVHALSSNIQIAGSGGGGGEG